MAAVAMDISTPPSASPTRKNRRSTMSIDLSDLPPLSQPTPPSNTLIVTNLQAPEIFTSANLASIQHAIGQHAAIHTFSPLKSFRRIICSFFDAEAAIAVRQLLDGETVLGSRVRVYFGAPTKLALDEDQHLRAPKSDKLFFISPPPSPPMGWEMRNEDPPNTDVHADDLALALSRLDARSSSSSAAEELANGPATPMSPQQLGGGGGGGGEGLGGPPSAMRTGRARSGTGTVVYDPQDHGHSPDLPAIAVEDTTENAEDVSPMDTDGRDKAFIHTSRPPVELMES